MGWPLFDRIRQFVRQANLYRSDNLFQDQTDLSRFIFGNAFFNFRQTQSLIEQTNLQINRLERYKDYAQMDEVGEIYLALDLYADEASMQDPERKHVIAVRARSQRVKNELEDLFFNTLLIDNKLRPLLRYLCKYGDFSAEIIPTQNRDAVASFRFMNIFNFTRVETKYGDLIGFFYQDEFAMQPVFLHPWQVMHLRLTNYENIFHPYGRCSRVGTRVLTPSGYKNIEDFKMGDEVCVYDNGKVVDTKVVAACHSGEKEILKIKSRHFVNECSENHPVLIRVWEKKPFKFGKKWFSELSYKRADELEIGDELVIPRIINDNDDYIVLGDVDGRVIKADEDFAKLFGFLIGDGWLAKSHGKSYGISFACGVNEDRNNYYAELLGRYSPNKISANSKKCANSSLPIQEMFTSSVVLADFIESDCGFIQGCKNKRVPQWVYSSPRSVQVAFIEGLMDADGSSFTDKWDCTRHQIELSNYELIKDIKMLLHNINWKCGNIIKRKRESSTTVIHGKEYNRSASWFLYFFKTNSFARADSSSRFRGTSGACRKKECTTYGKDVLFEPIVSIERAGVHPTADIQVDHPASNFIADGVVVHNSILDASRKTFKQLRLMEDAAIIYRLCLRGDSRIWTPSGYKEIKNIKEGDEVYCYTRKEKIKKTRVTYWAHNGTDKIYRIYSRHREIFANKTHPILVEVPYQEGGEWRYRLEYVDVQDLKTLSNTTKKYAHRFVLPRKEEIKEYVKLKKPRIPHYIRLKKPIAVSCGLTALGNKAGLHRGSIERFLNAKHDLVVDRANIVCNLLEETPEHEIIEGWSYDSQNRKATQFNIPDVANEEFARWFGFMIGDGFVSKRKHRANQKSYTHEVGFALGNKKDVNERYKKLFEKIIGIKVKFSGDNGYRLGRYGVYSSAFVDFMQMNGFIPGAHNKRVPNWIFESPRSVQEAFLDGYVDADGHRRITRGGTHTNELCCCNKELMEDIKELCHQLGWTAGLVRERERKGGHVIDKETDRTMPSTTCYELYFTKNLAPRSERILGIEEIGDDEIYDFEVEAEEHNFIVQGISTANTRAPERRVFTIPVGHITPKEVPGYIQEIAATLKKRRIFDPASGEVNERWSPLIQEDDYFLPQRPDGTGPKVDTLPGAENLDQIADIEYFKKKMVSPLKIPFSRVGLGEGAGEDQQRQPLAAMAPEFAKAIQWIQREVAIGLKKIAIVHLSLKGYSMDDMRHFDVALTSASAIDELYRMETWNSRVDVIGGLKEIGMFPDEWILESFTNLTQDEIELMKDKMRKTGALPQVEETGLGGLEGELGGEAVEGEGAGGGEGGAGGGLPTVELEGFDSEAEKEMIQEYNNFEYRMDVLSAKPKEIESAIDSLLGANELSGLPQKVKEGQVLVESVVLRIDEVTVSDEIRSILMGKEDDEIEKRLAIVEALCNNEKNIGKNVDVLMEEADVLLKESQNSLQEDVEEVINGDQESSDG